MGSIDKMTEHAGELLFEASGQNPPVARGTIKELAHHLGRLYGETIRACRGYDGLQDEVTTTFMCGMAIEPNFGREEEVKVRRGAEDRGYKKLKALLARTKEERTAGQVLYEGQPHGAANRPWAKLSDNSRRAFEKEAVFRAMPAVGAIRITEEEMRDPSAEVKTPDIEARTGADGLTHWHVKTSAPVGTKAVAALDTALREGTLGEDKEVKEMAEAAKKCWKCKGTGDMGFSTHVPCDAC